MSNDDLPNYDLLKHFLQELFSPLPAMTNNRKEKRKWMSEGLRLKGAPSDPQAEPCVICVNHKMPNFIFIIELDRICYFNIKKNIFL